MKTAVKLLLVAAVLNGVVRTGMSAMTYYQLTDAARQMLVFGQRATPDELQDGIVSKASELSVPLTADNLVVRRDSLRTVAIGAYTEAVEVFPPYRYPIDYSFTVEALSVR